jgi:hypothetical protein
MHTNTSRAMTAFSDFAAPADHPLHPAAEQIHAYLRAYAQHFGVTDRIRLHSPVSRVSRARAVDGERFDAVVVASGRFRKPRLPPGMDAFDGDVIHAFEYPGAGPYRDRRTLVYGNGISGLEIASDLAPVTAVVSAFRKPRYVIQKVVDGVSSDWQWYTAFGALQRRLLSRDALSRTLRDRVLRVAGNPAAFGAPEPHGDILTAGLSRKGFALWAMDLFGVARARTGGHERAPRSVMRPRVGRAANVLLRASRRDVARLRSANRCGSRARIEARSPNDT